jgi:putative N6-adenine-specific DNA methylase
MGVFTKSTLRRSLRLKMKLFAVCTPGLEPFTFQELGRLGLSSSPLMETEEDPERGGIEFEGSLIDLYRCNLHLRTASRVLVRLGSFYTAGFPELRRKVANLPWEPFLKAGQPVALRVTCHRSRLYHQRAVAERVAGAISERLKQTALPSPPSSKGGVRDIQQTPSQLILVRIANDHCTISIDSSGELLHRRGYRLATTKAPLRETVAAAMLLASGWDRLSPLLDPFCGSGTIAIEAALMARPIPPGRSRHFAFMDWPNFDRNIWETLLSEVSQDHSSPFPKIIASDRDAGAIRAAKANAERAGVAKHIDFSCHVVSSMEPPADRGWVVTNPPYGVRTASNKDLRNLYAQFGKVLRAKCPGWQVAILCSNVQLLHQTGLDLDKGISLMNGGIKVRLVMGKVNQGRG